MVIIWAQIYFISFEFCVVSKCNRAAYTGRKKLIKLKYAVLSFFSKWDPSVSVSTCLTSSAFTITKCPPSVTTVVHCSGVFWDKVYNAKVRHHFRAFLCLWEWLVDLKRLQVTMSACTEINRKQVVEQCKDFHHGFRSWSFTVLTTPVSNRCRGQTLRNTFCAHSCVSLLPHRSLEVNRKWWAWEFTNLQFICLLCFQVC